MRVVGTFFIENKRFFIGASLYWVSNRCNMFFETNFYLSNIFLIIAPSSASVNVAETSIGF